MCFKDYAEFINQRGADLAVVNDRDLYTKLDSGSEVTKLEVCSNEGKLIGIRVTRGSALKPVPTEESEPKVDEKPESEESGK